MHLATTIIQPPDTLSGSLVTVPQSNDEFSTVLDRVSTVHAGHCSGLGG
jgi:hypothetical protein